MKGLDPLEPRSKQMTYYYEINETRCLYCGLCVEVCPVEAIIMSHHFEMATDNRGETVYDKHKLLDLGKTYMAELKRASTSRPGFSRSRGHQRDGRRYTRHRLTHPPRFTRPSGPEQPR